MEEKKNKKALDWNALSAKEAEVKVDQLSVELFQLRLNARFRHNPSFSSDQQKLKKSVARGLTYINQNKRQKGKE